MLNYDELPDEQLVQFALEKEDHFYHLTRRYEPKLLRFIGRTTNVTHEEAEDILQEIFLKVYLNLNGFDATLKFSSWIYRIARNEIINQYHKRKSSSHIVNINENDAANILPELTGQACAHDEFITKENIRLINKALEKLPEKYREVLVLRFLEDKSYEEISDILQKPGGTVAARLNRAKAKFCKIASRQNLGGLI